MRHVSSLAELADTPLDRLAEIMGGQVGAACMGGGRSVCGGGGGNGWGNSWMQCSNCWVDWYFLCVCGGGGSAALLLWSRPAVLPREQGHGAVQDWLNANSGRASRAALRLA